ncbi:response regulator transcription factor [Skermania sp. ID1734]|uniref:helix-turn-helix transcriptional regulator n=1 Tax=Skermania sp. ID1734 TaxID=2597516 RepID=UPI00117FC09A|nr:LuxR C-terminal-related transcriptional regulator [Skermania sp. ID1734]TSD93541.1 response regulator transcription factor [Skermania sp. ID1734]
MSTAASLLRPRDSVLRPRDGDAVLAELRRAARAATTPILFGGEVHNDTLLLSEFVGTRTAGLRGLTIPRLSGLGGQVIDLLRPASVADYSSASTITHHYDGPVLGEGIRSVLAVPVVVDGVARAVLYAAQRLAAPVPGRTADTLIQASKRLTAELRIRDEVDRRLQMSPPRPAVASGPLAEELRSIHAELRTIAHAAPGDVQRQLHALTRRLADAMRDTAGSSEVELTPRELDVLAQVALGCTNSDAAQRLSLRPETVKSYLRSAMGKLDAHSRHEAVVRARSLGLLP